MTAIVLLLLLGIALLAMRSAGSKSTRTANAGEPIQPGASRSRSRPAPLPSFTIELVGPARNRGSAQRVVRPSPAELAQAGDRAWVPCGQNVHIAGKAISGGMLYVGDELPPIASWHSREPALIDPGLPVDWHSPDRGGTRMNYWPSYSEIPPECRAAYLDWLATGRSDPDAYIGFVFLYFYGLERRLLFDLRMLPERKPEGPPLLLELERLLTIYGENRSFQRYGTSLLQTARALWGDAGSGNRPPSFPPGQRDLPAEVRLAVGRLVAQGKPIPGDWALAWVVGHPETQLRTPARRCPDEFHELFLRRYKDRFGEGLLLKPNKRRLRLSHAPASASFGGPVEIPFDELPDVTGLTRPLSILRELAEAASAELESYSRFIGRVPARTGSLQALALLPPELAATRENPDVKPLQQWIDSTLGLGERAVSTAADLIRHWPCARPDRIAKTELGSFARFLEAHGCGIEPDPRYGGGALAADQELVLFRLRGEPISAVSPNYHAATLLLHLAAAVASSDGEIGDDEERHLEEHLERSMDLTAAEVQRLRAHLHWLLASRASFNGLKRRLEAIDEPGRHRLAQFAAAIAGADGIVAPDEVRTLGKIYRLLGLDSDQTYADLHSLQARSTWTPAERPVTVRPPDAKETGYAIPGRPSETPDAIPALRLDMDRVQRTLAETATVSSVLAAVFAEDDEADSAPAATLALVDSITGMDAPHAQLLRALIGRAELSRQEFEELAEALNLLPEGAFEVLNEAAFERVDRPLLEGEDPICVDRDALAEVMR